MPRDVRLMKYSQEISDPGNPQTWRPVEFDAPVAPVLVKQSVKFRLVTQSGSAVCNRVMLNPPAPLFPNSLLDTPDIKFKYLGNGEWQTTWSYVMAVEDAEEIDVVAASKWPADPASDPGFTGVT